MDTKLIEQSLEEVEKYYSEREKKLIDGLVDNYTKMSDDEIRLCIMTIQLGRIAVGIKRLHEETTDMEKMLNF